MIKRMVRTIIISVALVGALTMSCFASVNQEVLTSANNLVEVALTDKCFGNYNIALAEIMKLEDGQEKTDLQNRLSIIANDVFTDDIKYYVDLLIELSKSGSAKLYDRLESELRASNLYYIDREYLLGELTSWGKKLVYTEDYKVGVDSVVNAWNVLAKAQYNNDTNTLQAINNAENLIKNVVNSANKDYLGEQLQQVKDKLAEKDSVPVEDHAGLVQTSNGRWLKFDDELTNKLNATYIPQYERNMCEPRTQDMIQSAINISQGKDVVDNIKKSNQWYSHTWDKGDIRDISYYKRSTHNIVNSDKAPKSINPNLEIKPDWSNSAGDFEYAVAYYDPETCTYEIHYIWIVF